MGGQCQRPHQFTNDIKNKQQIQHPVFGEVFRIRGESKNQAYKQIYSYGIDAEQFRRRFELAKESNEAVATLVQVYDCSIVGQHVGDVTEKQKYSLNCRSAEDSYIMLTFQYFQPKDSLISIFQSRNSSLQKLRKRLGANIIQNAQSVKLYNYHQIDRLPSQQRQVVNNYFQEIQILRMIDHIVGALYFLHHYDVAHGAVRPESLLVDSEGKYLLADRQLFGLATNYQLALKQITSQQDKQSSKQQCFQFIAPEWLSQLKQLKSASNYGSQKSDIFCVGLLALKMCLLNWSRQLFSFNSLSKSIDFNEKNLIQLLSQVKIRYSDDFFELLILMLKKNPRQRLDFSQLIDQLNPVLLKNLQSIKQLHSPACTHSKPKTMIQSTIVPVVPDKAVLKEQLQKMEDKFQRVMNKRTLLIHSEANHQTVRLQEQKLLKRLQMLQSTKSKTQRKQNLPENPSVRTFQLNQSPNTCDPPSKDEKRYLNGQELQRIVWREYQNLKKSQGTL